MLHMAAGMVRLISLIAITYALTISLITITDYSKGKSSSMNNEYSSWSSREYFEQEEIKVMPFKASRFLAENKKEKKSNPRASDHCKKDNEICGLVEAGGGTNSTCCNNKCMDLSSDKDNCGACKNKCVYTDTCCRGECVNINYDKRHCGKCNNRCMPGGFCIYGLCDYA